MSNCKTCRHFSHSGSVIMPTGWCMKKRKSTSKRACCHLYAPEKSKPQYAAVAKQITIFPDY